MKPTRKHPNALVSLGAGLGLGTVVVQVGAHYGLDLSAEQGLGIASILAAAALFVGRNGFVGTWAFVKKTVLHGTGKGKP